MRVRHARSVLLIPVLMACLFAVPLYAQPLDERIPGLFGGSFAVSISRQDTGDTQRPQVADRFRTLSAALAAARSQAPVPSASGAFGFAWDPDLDTFVRTRQSLGSTLAERAQTLGRRTGTLSVSYSRVDFDTLEGDRLDNLVSTQPALSEAFINMLPEAARALPRQNQIETRLDLHFGFDLVFFTVAYGLTDTIDVSAALSVNQARMRARADAMITGPSGDGSAVFTERQQGVIIGGTGACSLDFRCATDGFDTSKLGTGDLFLRSKWHFADTPLADLSVAGVLTLPTGNANDFLGYHDVTFTPWMIASKQFGPLSPHLNLGYSFRSGKDVSQAQWIAGADFLAFKQLTLTTDFLGFHDDKRDGINDNVLQSALGFKVNPFGQLVLAGNFQFPLNRDGLRADVIYTGQVEWTF